MRNVKIKNGVDIKWKEKAEFLCIFHPFGESMRREVWEPPLRMGFMCELFDGIRIDHFRGLESYFSIPAGETTARNGVWKKGPGMSLIRALKPVCENKLIIAEDLGDITPEVYRLVQNSGSRITKEQLQTISKEKFRYWNNLYGR